MALLWIAAADRDAVTRAANEIERILKFAPLSRKTDQGKHYSLTIEPLTVIYTVSQADCLVTILSFLNQA